MSKMPGARAQGFGRGLGSLLAWCALWGGASCTESSEKAEEIAVSGRVLNELELPLSGVTVVAPGQKQSDTDAQGKFDVAYVRSHGSSLEAQSKQAAPVSKPAPSSKSHVELHMKTYDQVATIDPKLGGSVQAGGGAKLAVEKDQLVQSDGANAERAELVIAVPDTKQASGLGSIPGNFDAKHGQQTGKLSTQSVVYVGAKDGDKVLALKSGTKAKLSLPKETTSKAVGDTLYRFDLSSQLWLEAGAVSSGMSDAGDPIYLADVDQLGWFAVGEFYDAFTCLSGCVVTSGTAATGAQVLVTGVDHASQVIGFLNDQGCFALDVRRGASVSVLAQTLSHRTAPLLVTTSDQPLNVQGGSACPSVGTLELLERSAPPTAVMDGGTQTDAGTTRDERDAAPMAAPDAAPPDTTIACPIDENLYCGRTCELCVAPTNATARCDADGCGYTCLPDRGDCNGDPLDGCEVDLLSHPHHCGECSMTCSLDAVCNQGNCGCVGTPGVVDQAQLTIPLPGSARYINKTASRSIGQGFTAGISGILTGIDIKPFICETQPQDHYFRVELLDATDQVLGAANLPYPDQSTCTEAFPPGQPSSGFVDLSGACIQVTQGQLYRYRVTIEGYPTPECLDNQCSEGGAQPAGTLCFDAAECDFSGINMAIVSGNVYAGGAQRHDEMAEEPDIDLPFRTWVRSAP